MLILNVFFLFKNGMVFFFPPMSVIPQQVLSACDIFLILSPFHEHYSSLYVMEGERGISGFSCVTFRV